MANDNFKKNATDGDGDGMVQDGTPFERPEKINNENKVAIYSNRSIYWPEVGRLAKGFNIVAPGKAEKWLTLRGIRTATPAEVAKEYGL